MHLISLAMPRYSWMPTTELAGSHVCTWAQKSELHDVLQELPTIMFLNAPPLPVMIM